MANSTNKCPHPTCSVQKPFSMFSCRNHWYGLPRDLRVKIWEAYNNNGPLSPEWLAAAKEAEAFWMKHQIQGSP